MSYSIFYSWQSDIDKSLNRDFIEKALEDAIKILDQDIQIQESLRNKKLLIDRDVKGIPGTPPIVSVIFEKINKSSIFIPDLTFVGKTEKNRLLPNPNVLIEYGWAINSLSHERMVPVMNTAFGEPDEKNMPFDMRHLKWPICYHLPENSTKAQKNEIKKQLSRELTEAIKLIIEAGLIKKKVFLIDKATLKEKQNILEKRIKGLLHLSSLDNSMFFLLSALPLNEIEIPHLFENNDSEIVKLIHNPPSLRHSGFNLEVGEFPKIIDGVSRCAFLKDNQALQVFEDGTALFATRGDKKFLCYGNYNDSQLLAINPASLIESVLLFMVFLKEIYTLSNLEFAHLQINIELKNIKKSQKKLILRNSVSGWSSFRSAPIDANEVKGTIFLDGNESRPERLAYLLLGKFYQKVNQSHERILFTKEVDGEKVIDPEKIKALKV